MAGDCVETRRLEWARLSGVLNQFRFAYERIGGLRLTTEPLVRLLAGLPNACGNHLRDERSCWIGYQTEAHKWTKDLTRMDEHFLEDRPTGYFYYEIGVALPSICPAVGGPNRTNFGIGLVDLGDHKVLRCFVHDSWADGGWKKGHSFVASFLVVSFSDGAVFVGAPVCYQIYSFNSEWSDIDLTEEQFARFVPGGSGVSTFLVLVHVHNNTVYPPLGSFTAQNWCPI
jgi:hypothetical protein